MNLKEIQKGVRLKKPAVGTRKKLFIIKVLNKKASDPCGWEALDEKSEDLEFA